MDHKESVTKKMAESYLLDELTPEERDAFEEHYFSCQECAQEVKAGAMLVANIKEVLHAEPALEIRSEPGRSRPGWLSWLQPAYGLAAMLLLGVVAYQNLVMIPQLHEQAKGNVSQALPYFSFIDQGSREGKEAVVLVDRKQPFVLYIDIPASDNFASYSLEVQSANGTPLFSAPVSVDAAKNTVPLFVRGSLLEPGKYFLVIHGNRNANNTSQAATEIARYPFAFENKN